MKKTKDTETLDIFTDLLKENLPLFHKASTMPPPQQELRGIWLEAKNDRPQSKSLSKSGSIDPLAQFDFDNDLDWSCRFGYDLLYYPCSNTTCDPAASCGEFS